MPPDRWARIDSIVQAALVRPVASREAFVLEACGDDDALAQEVRSLLTQVTVAGSFLETAPRGAAALEPGQTLGPYTIRELIGVGGMGEVYRAFDPRLGRDVALKILPSEVARDPERLRRFQIEARAAAAITHPNIVTIYSVEQADDLHFLTMELVDGTPLSESIPRDGFAVDRLLEIAIPLADAVAAAHARGIVHRDLKPANVMVGRDGRIKVLDFGLAKLKPPAGISASPDTSMPSLTADGRLLGTVAYMSPEQAEGREVDQRSDVFALGVVLYEMSTGRRPFTGDTTVAVLSSILRDTPAPVGEIKKALPREFDRIVDRCLQKHPGHRYQSSRDLCDDLAAVALAQKPRASSPLWAPWAVAAVGTLALSVAGIWYWGDASRPVAISAEFAKVTHGVGVERYPSLSPDGRELLYVAGPPGNSDIFLQQVGIEIPVVVNLTNASLVDDTQAVFSPTGEAIAFRSLRDGGGLFVMRRDGGEVRRLTREGFNPSWTSDGKHLLYATENTIYPDEVGGVSTIRIVNVATRETRQVSNAPCRHPAASPSQQRIACHSGRDILTMRFDGTDVRSVTEDEALDWNPVWSPDGAYLYYVSDRSGTMNLWRVRIDEGSGLTVGQPEAVAAPSPWVGHLTRFSRDGQLAYAAYHFNTNISRIVFDPATRRTTGAPVDVTSGTLTWDRADPSPDGTALALFSYRRREDIYRSRPDGTDLRRLTDSVSPDRMPRWSPDGRSIAFYSMESGKSVLKILDEKEQARIAVDSTRGGQYPVWSPAGDRLLSLDPRSRRSYIFTVGNRAASEPDQTLAAYPRPGATWLGSSWFKDGRIAGYVDRPDGRYTGFISVYSLETSTYQDFTHVQCATGHDGPVWLNDGRRLLYILDGTIRLLDTATGKSHQVLAIPGETLARIAITRDKRRLFFTRGTTTADVWMLKLN